MGPSISMPCCWARFRTSSKLGWPRLAMAAAAREKFSMRAPGACTTKATASASVSLRMVWGVPPARGTTDPAAAVGRHAPDAGVRCGVVADVEGELALEDVVNLAGRVSMEER
jgi:hypothetical protein